MLFSDMGEIDIKEDRQNPHRAAAGRSRIAGLMPIPDFEGQEARRSPPRPG
ncbi:MAG: hypothetical protein U0R26_09065 [Solirubrobacterales bacterium]